MNHNLGMAPPKSKTRSVNPDFTQVLAGLTALVQQQIEATRHQTEVARQQSELQAQQMRQQNEQIQNLLAQ